MKNYVRKLCMGICLMVLCVGMTALAAEDTILKGVKIVEGTAWGENDPAWDRRRDGGGQSFQLRHFLHQ